MTAHFDPLDGAQILDSLIQGPRDARGVPLVMNPGDFAEAKAAYPDLDAVMAEPIPRNVPEGPPPGWPLDDAALTDLAEQALADIQRRDLLADSAGWPAYVGLDLSLTGTGVAVRYTTLINDPDRPVTHLVKSDPADYRSARDAKDKPVATYADRLARLEDVLAEIEALIPTGSLVFLEAPSYGSNTSGTFDRSGLWWLAYQRLTALSCRVIPVAPTQRMLYATGKGRADKDQVLSAVVTRYPDLGVTNNNTADAVVLMAMAARAAGSPIEDRINVANLRAMDKLEAL